MTKVFATTRRMKMKLIVAMQITYGWSIAETRSKLINFLKMFSNFSTPLTILLQLHMNGQISETRGGSEEEKEALYVWWLKISNRQCYWNGSNFIIWVDYYSGYQVRTTNALTAERLPVLKAFHIQNCLLSVSVLAENYFHPLKFFPKIMLHTSD